MTGEDQPPPESMQVALVQIQSSVNSGFADQRVELTAIRGQLDLLIQRQDQQERRADHQAADIAALDGRMRDVETTRATHTAVQALDTRVDDLASRAVTHDQADTQHRRTVGIITAIVGALGVLLSGAGVGVAILLG